MRRVTGQSDIPAGGVMTARAADRMYAGLLGEVDGERLISPDRLSDITTVSISGTDEITGHHTSRGLGYDFGFQSPLDSATWFGIAGSGDSQR